MGKHHNGGGLRFGGLIAASVAGATIAVCAIPATSGAATVTPTSYTTCKGNVSPDKSGKANDEPNLLDYSFSCDSGITAYTVFVDQAGDPGGSIDDFAPAPSVLETDDATPSPTESVTCEGVTPSDGINCNTGALGSQITLGYFIAGTVDPIQTYCKHLPMVTSGKTTTTAKPGTPAVPTAKVELVVTDYTGAQDGPFALRLKQTCPTVPDVVPAPTTTAATPKKRHKHHTTTKQS